MKSCGRGMLRPYNSRTHKLNTSPHALLSEHHQKGEYNSPDILVSCGVPIGTHS